MAKSESGGAAAPGGNITKLKQDVKIAAEKVTKLVAKRQGINDEINGLRHDIEAKGIARKAFDAALAYSNADPEKREGFDIGYSIAREALGVPLQGDLFDGDGPSPGEKEGKKTSAASDTKRRGKDTPAPNVNQSGQA